MERCVSVRRKEAKSGRIIWKGSNVEGDAVEGPVVGVGKEEVLQALYEMKTGKCLGPYKISLELIATSGGVGIQVMAEICQSPRWIWNVS